MKTKIKQYRAAKGLTQQELANLVQVRRETIVFLEKGKYNPSLKLGVLISRVLDVPIEELFDIDD
ncbi:helix-turn-helix transcriptional regulator [Candidatus Xianfuyuplasma coldseepsis]|uniref:Helix-turn-helix transcriptional regulator n=1 Tax=Candidatus Xianfuyuplasma coldseepsis TaxID=2782163 RepID=A0A7L7KTH2_9MOLU|nr:helix-turn-helix transcriptional regulator [Xianfuyuplasma coldseepsis]QMS86007.1 helix-turn-helix transcriptional regulator [Xianfuyuplasma coldseepsis]